MRKKAVITILFLTSLAIPAEKLPFCLKEERKFTGIEIFPLDINQDKTDELLKISDYNMQLLDQKGRVYWDYYFLSNRFKTFSVLDINQDGIKEIFASYTKGATEIVNCYGSTKSGNLIKSLPTVKTTDKNQDGKWDGSVTAINCIDANDDGNLDLLLNVGCGFDLQPRGLAVYDLKTGKELWHYWIGPIVVKIIVEDINDDLKPEIIVGTYSPANGSSANNTTDLASYVIVLDCKGKLLWQQQTGEYFCETEIAASDIDKDGKKEVIVATSSKRESYESDKILILTPDGKLKKSIQTGENFWGMACSDINLDGCDEIITGNLDGKIRVFNSDLDEILTYDNHRGIDVMGVYDLIGDGRKEIITTTEDNKLVIFNHQLKVIAQLPLAKGLVDQGFGLNSGAIKLVREQKTKKVLISQPAKDETEFILYRFEPTPIAKRTGHLFNAILLNLIILGLIISYILWWLLTYSERVAKKFYSKITQIGYILFNRQGKIKVANVSACNLLGIKNLNNANLFAELQKAGLTELSNKLKDFQQFENETFTIKDAANEKILSLNFYQMPRRNIYTLRIEDITKLRHLGQIETWAPVAQKLAHGMKTPLMNIQLATEQLAEVCQVEDKQRAKELVHNIREEIARLRKLTDSFLRFTRFAPLDLQAEDINRILKELIDKYSLTIGSGIKLKLELGEKLPLVRIDRKEIEYALEVIINNAVEAMANKGTLVITSLFHQTFEGKIKNWVRVIISDTGKGIPEKYLQSVFDPYFTFDKPTGIGLGLTLAKQIIEKHQGTIEIQSKEGVGTTVTINLPA